VVRRRLFNLAAAVSLGMMLAVVVLWVRSYSCLDFFRILNSSHRALSLTTRPGVLEFSILKQLSH
jgi:hypothetical protein